VLLKLPAVDITIHSALTDVHSETYLRCGSQEILKRVLREVLDPEDELRFFETSEIRAQRHSL
jgi:hypothetical protein